ncbi:SPFH domain-containing protein [uncultured Eubacterium sp.]|uniref:SPFH domain-containing protein n=1 Tax=uncultured Eubacterium sp. TaxID=165185 RepID=UPI0025F6EBC1|nr:SPFH domain-containing protein [uncultured Eubacterium sp.]
MSLFNKNPNETFYTGGKKHWTDVIKNNSSGEPIIWRQPEEDFNTNSTLIVMPGEEAIFIKEGIIEQVFENGTYKLSTENYPFISRLRNAFSGGISTFNCIVYFVRKADSKEIRWGTETPIQVRDKIWGIRTDARVRGIYKVRIENPGKFLEKLIGNNIQIRFQEELDMYFANEFQGKIKATISKFLNSLNQELIGLDAYMDELSEKIEPYINETVSDYGLKCVKFSLAGLDIDTTKYDAIDVSQIELIAKRRNYEGSKSGLDILGNDWEKIQNVEILKDLANNSGAGGVAAVGAGIGMGIGTAGTFGSVAQQIFTPQQSINSEQESLNNNFKQNNKAFEDPIKSLKKLKEMLDDNLIEQTEYDSKKAEILSRM